MCQGQRHGKITFTLFEWTLVFIQEVHIFNAYYSFSWVRYNDVGSNELGFTFSMINTHKRSVLIWFLYVCNQFSVLLGSANPSYDSPCVQCGTFSLQTVGSDRKRTTFPPNVHVFMLTQKVLQLEVRVRRELLWVNSDRQGWPWWLKEKGFADSFQIAVFISLIID